MSSTEKKLLVVDDDASIRESLRLILSRFYTVTTACGSEQALEMLSKENDFPNLVLLDVMMPGIGGLALLEKLRAMRSDIPIIMLTASNSVQTAVKAMKIGAVDYLSKPYDVDELLSLISETLASGAKGRTSPTNLRSQAHLRKIKLADLSGDFGQIIGRTGPMKALYRQIEKLSEINSTILITGKSGTGKELVARELHRRSKRSEESFVVVDCATISERQLFGNKEEVGLVQQANKGTLFFDEVANLSLELQAKVLRFLETKKYYPVATSSAKDSDLRLIASTQYQPTELVDSANFRNDLLHRINVITLEIPELSERVEDIIPIFNFYLNSIAQFYGGRKLELSQQVIRALENYCWPGNVRELENLAESLLALCSSSKVELEDLPRRFREQNENYKVEEEVLAGKIPFEEAEKAFEKELIIRALAQANYVQTKAAEILGITRRVLKYKMDKLGIAS